jgi:hypothetical protein
VDGPAPALAAAHPRLNCRAPVAVATIGTLPLPVMHRSIMIHMARRDGRRQLTRLDKDDADTKADLNVAYRMMLRWARDAELTSDPPMPAPLRVVVTPRFHKRRREP